MERIELKNCLDSKLQTFAICSVKILNILEVIAKARFSKITKCSTLILDGAVEINEEKRSLLRDQIRQQIVSKGLENEQEAIYRFMGDICTDIINSN